MSLVSSSTLPLAASSSVTSSRIAEPVRVITKLSGRLVHNDRKGTPLHHMKVRIGVDISFRPDPDTITTQSNMDGFFSAECPFLLTDGKPYIEIIDNPWELQGEERLIGKRIYINPEEGNLGDIALDYWEYQEGRPMLSMPKKDKPQTATTKYTLAFIKGALPFKAISTGLKAAGFPLSPEQTQKLYPDNLTIKKEVSAPGSTKTAEWMGERILKGFNPCPLLKGTEDDEYRIVIDWNRFEMDRQYQLPNIEAILVLKEGSLKVTEVRTQWRKEINSGDTNPPVYKKKCLNPMRLTDWTAVKQGSPEFERALRIFRTAYLATGEIDEHLGAGHLNVEQYAVAAFRNLHKNPLKNLLFPHLREVVLINDTGAEIIFGPTGALTTTTALTDKGVDLRFKRKLGHMDYTDWHPRKPICENHTFAKAENLYWGVVEKWVDQFFKENEKQITEEWEEIHTFSNDLVNHSVPYHRLEGQKLHAWSDLSEIDASKAPRKIVKGKKKAIRPITESNSPEGKDIERLKQACKYMIFFSTFWHSWVHNLQQEDVGDIEYGTLGIKKGGELPDAEEVVTQLELANILPNVNHGFVTKNENGDIDPRFIALLNDERKGFEALGINIDKFIRCCINI